MIAGQPTTWAVTVQLGYMDGEGGVPLFQTYWIDDSSSIRARYPKMVGGDRAASFVVETGRTVVVFASGGDDKRSQTVSFWTVEKAPAKVYQMMPESDNAVSTSALLTFTDADGDNRRDILVEKTIRDFNRKQKWREYQLI